MAMVKFQADFASLKILFLKDFQENIYCNAVGFFHGLAFDKNLWLKFQAEKGNFVQEISQNLPRKNPDIFMLSKKEIRNIMKYQFSMNHNLKKLRLG